MQKKVKLTFQELFIMYTLNPIRVILNVFHTFQMSIGDLEP